MQLSHHKKAVLALIAANFIWGAASPIFKWSLTDIHPFTLGFLRFFLAALLLFPFVRQNLRMERKDVKKFFIMGIFGLTFHISLFFYGLQYTSSINAPIIGSSGPVFLLIGSILILKERPKKKAVIGMTISLLGVLIIVLQPVFERGLDQSFIGNLFIVLATIVSVIYTIMLKELSKSYTTMQLTFWSFAIASLGFIPLVFFESLQYGSIPQIHLPGLIGIYFGVIFSSALAYYLYAYACKNIVTAEVGIFTYLDPVVAILIAIPLLGEKIDTAFVMGAIFVFMGIIIAERRLPWHPLHMLRNHV